MVRLGISVELREVGGGLDRVDELGGDGGGGVAGGGRRGGHCVAGGGPDVGSCKTGMGLHLTHSQENTVHRTKSGA